MSRPHRSSPYIIETLERRHDRKAFSCGQADLDRYLKQQARQDNQRRVAATFVAIERGKTVVVGYYGLSAAGVPLRDLPPQTAARLPRYPLVPATLLGRLAVDRNHQGRKLGEFLLVDALRRSLAQSDEIRSGAVIVDAIDDRARSFYEHFQFIPFADQPRRLFLPLESIAALFGPRSTPQNRPYVDGSKPANGVGASRRGWGLPHAVLRRQAAVGRLCGGDGKVRMLSYVG